jgi:NAD+ synthase (glutamine-hydrolysing)
MRSSRPLLRNAKDEHTVRRILRLIDIAEYKRKQAALGLKVSTVAFGSGRRWPIASKRRF